MPDLISFCLFTFSFVPKPMKIFLLQLIHMKSDETCYMHATFYLVFSFLCIYHFIVLPKKNHLQEKLIDMFIKNIFYMN